MSISRKVILDLLPLYIADEASEDTKILVEKYLETDPELADIAKRLATKELPGESPVPLNKEDEMETYKEAKRLLFQRVMVIAALLAASVVAVLVLAAIIYFFFKG
ncbi:MAG: hypothetical protein JSV33_08125 [bacterium]|nr:MAG: hypothetical protein JSV33_08125 [bacterium]